jgi:hypothetical protein
MKKRDKIITTAIVLILSTHLSNAQSKTTASLENPISIMVDGNVAADTAIGTSYSFGVYMVPSTVGAVTPATFHSKETRAYANGTLQVDDPKRNMMFKQATITGLIASNTAKP